MTKYKVEFEIQSGLTPNAVADTIQGWVPYCNDVNVQEVEEE